MRCMAGWRACAGQRAAARHPASVSLGLPGWEALTATGSADSPAPVDKPTLTPTFGYHPQPRSGSATASGTGAYSNFLAASHGSLAGLRSAAGDGGARGGCARLHHGTA